MIMADVNESKGPVREATAVVRQKMMAVETEV